MPKDFKGYGIFPLIQSRGGKEAIVSSYWMIPLTQSASQWHDASHNCVNGGVTAALQLPRGSALPACSANPVHLLSTYFHSPEIIGIIR